jgi:hypothetical protein
MRPTPHICNTRSSWPGPATIITNTPHNTDEACAIVRNLIALVEEQNVDFVAALFRSIWGAEPGRLPYLNRSSFFGEILCCWRPRWIVGSQGSPMHAYAWYVLRKEPRSGPTLKVRVSKSETITALSAVNLPMCADGRDQAFANAVTPRDKSVRALPSTSGRPPN